ncbi:methionine--tRNA ligase [Rickettsiales bacterium LUAb2]
MSQKYYYITSPIYYVNDKPHIGHFYTTLACDVIARFKRLDGYKVIFSTGTDEHGQKIEQKAKSLDLSPQQMVDDLSQYFAELFKNMNFTNDIFMRTTNKDHIKNIEYIWQQLEAKGFIYKGSYEGYYSVSDEAFYTESELITKNGNLVAASSGSLVEKIQEESYFFSLSKFQDKLLEYYSKNPDFIAPKSRYNEVVSFVKSGLKDLSVSRIRITWGIKVPSDPSHVIYVWLDALSNYLSALGDLSENSANFKNYWPADLHMIGKDILRFHAVYWPAFLMALDLPLPKKIFAHGWWTNEGEKISKSKGNIIDPVPVVEKYGIDEFKYFLLKEIPFGNDGDYSEESLINRINNELANDYGNLCQRSLSIIIKNFNGKLVKPSNFNQSEQNLLEISGNNLLNMCRNYIDKQDFSNYIENIWSIIRDLNSYINKTAPWTLIKNNNLADANNVLYVIIEVLRRISILLAPVMPISTNNILNQLNCDEEVRSFTSINTPLNEYNVVAPSPVFTKHVNEKIIQP